MIPQLLVRFALVALVATAAVALLGPFATGLLVAVVVCLRPRSVGGFG